MTFTLRQVDHIFVAHSHRAVLPFTEKGRCVSSRWPCKARWPSAMAGRRVDGGFAVPDPRCQTTVTTVQRWFSELRPRRRSNRWARTAARADTLSTSPRSAPNARRHTFLAILQLPEHAPPSQYVVFTFDDGQAFNEDGHNAGRCPVQGRELSLRTLPGSSTSTQASTCSQHLSRSHDRQ